MRRSGRSGAGGAPAARCCRRERRGAQQRGGRGGLACMASEGLVLRVRQERVEDGAGLAALLVEGGDKHAQLLSQASRPRKRGNCWPIQRVGSSIAALVGTAARPDSSSRRTDRPQGAESARPSRALRMGSSSSSSGRRSSRSTKRQRTNRLFDLGTGGEALVVGLRQQPLADESEVGPGSRWRRPASLRAACAPGRGGGAAGARARVARGVPVLDADPDDVGLVLRGGPQEAALAPLVGDLADL